MRRIWPGLLALVAVLAAAAPAGAAGKLQPKHKATVKQVASVVAKRQGDLLDTLADLKSDCPLLTCNFTGQIETLTASFSAGTLKVELDAVDDRSSKNSLYIGTVPKELRRLVNETVAEAGDVQTTSKALSDCFTANQSICRTELGVARRAWDRLEDELNAWSPYL